jgi:hypothetical protein
MVSRGFTKFDKYRRAARGAAVGHDLGPRRHPIATPREKNARL